MKLSAAGWDEDNFIITLDHEHYTNHVAVRTETTYHAFTCYIIILIP